MRFPGRLLGETGQKNLEAFLGGVKDDYGIGREDWQSALYGAQDRKGLDRDMPKAYSLMQTHPTINRLRDVVGKLDPDLKAAQNELGIGLSQNPYRRAGQLVGTAGADITQDATRAIWWLINAPQAAAEITQEVATEIANRKSNAPYIYGNTVVTNPKTNEPVKKSQFKLAKELGLVDSSGKKRRGVDINEKGEYEKRNTSAGLRQALSIPTGIAINSSLGLLTPFGGAEGYMAAIPSDEDPTKTDNLLAEVATKYILGRTGGLLPYDEFRKVRPDVTPQEYAAYKGYRYSKDEDWNPLDGDINLLGGVVRGTTEGIHGPEVQFLGRSIPATTGLVPLLGAIGGTALGARRQAPIRGGLMGGFGGLTAGTIVGNLLEQERRRRNAEENGIQL